MRAVSLDHTERATSNGRARVRLGLIAFLAVVFCALIWPSYGEWKMAGVPNLAPPRLAKLALFATFAFYMLSSGVDTRNLSRRVRDYWGFMIVLGLFVSLRILSLALDTYPVLHIYAFIKQDIFENLLVFVATLGILRGRQDVNRVVTLLLVVAVSMGLIAGVEFALKHSVFSAVVSDANSATAMAAIDKTRDGFYRTSASFEHPLLLAQFAVAMLPLCWYWAGQRINGHRYLGFLAGLSTIACGVLSGTRSSLLLLALVGGCLAAFDIHRWLRRSGSGPLKWLAISQGIFVVVLCSIFLADKVQTIVAGRSLGERLSSLSRIRALELGVPKMLESPLTGYGPTHALDGVGFAGHLFDFIDNYYLLLGLQSGTFALAFFVGLILWAVISPMRSSRYADRSGDADRARLQFALSISMAAFGLMLVIHALAGLLVLMYLFFGLILVTVEDPNGQVLARRGFRRPPMRHPWPPVTATRLLQPTAGDRA